MTVLRVLFLDDSHERQRQFAMRRAGWVLVQAYTYGEAIKALAENPPFDEDHLDHDLYRLGDDAWPGDEVGITSE
jgi:hypothetical protein